MKKILEILALFLRDFSSVITYVSLFLWIIAMMYYLRWYSIFIVLFILILSDYLKKYAEHEYEVLFSVEYVKGKRETEACRVKLVGDNYRYCDIISIVEKRYRTCNMQIINIYKIK